MPRPLGDRLAVKFPDGLYASWWWPFGGMRLFTAVEKGRVKRWLTIERGGKAGCVDLEGRSQRFYANGTLASRTTHCPIEPTPTSRPGFAARSRRS